METKPFENTTQENAGHEARQAAALADAKRELAREHGIDTAFVRVGALAKILGLSPATIYGAIRQGRFFMPHRMLCSSPAVKLDDLARWWIGSESDREMAKPQPAEHAEPPPPAKLASGSRERDQIVNEVLKGMARRAARRP